MSVRERGCPSCGSPREPDQRYCLECGARVGSLPAAVATLIASVATPARAAAGKVASAAGVGHPPTDEEADEPFPISPRAAGVAVMALLSFGVIVGTAITPVVEGIGTAPLVLVGGPGPAPKSSGPVAGGASQTASSPATVSPAAPAAAFAQAPAYAPAATPVTKQTKPGAIPSEPTLPPIKHVFLIVLSDQGYAQSFDPGTADPYLSSTLRAQGELLPNYYSVTQGELANGIALISGQGPTPQTAADCPTYNDVSPGTVSPDGQVAGDGCEYPPAAQTLGDQLTTAKLTWKAYVEGIGSGGPGSAATCRHPASGSDDANHAPTPADPYVTWRNPFVYFHSLADGTACSQNDVGLDQLAPDLQAGTSAPALSYIVPNVCDDGSDQPCAPGQPSGLAASDAFLQQIVPQIQESPAYTDHGLIAITFDQAPQSGPNADSSSCCSTPHYPNLPASTGPSGTGTVSPTGGGGKVGLLLLSQYVIPGSSETTGYYNHFSLLRSIENIFNLPALGYGAQAPSTFDSTVFNGYFG